MTSPEDTPPQPPSLDNRPGGVATAEPASAPAADDQSGSPHRRETLTLPDDAAPGTALPGVSPTGEPRKRRRRRRRRKGPRPEGAPALGAAITAASPEGQTASSVDGVAPPQAKLTTETAAGAAETAPTGGEQPGTAPGGEPQRRRRRRRRRRGKRPEGASGAAGSAPRKQCSRFARTLRRSSR